jgi:hypothetical protein
MSHPLLGGHHWARHRDLADEVDGKVRTDKTSSLAMARLSRRKVVQFSPFEEVNWLTLKLQPTEVTQELKNLPQPGLLALCLLVQQPA